MRAKSWKLSPPSPDFKGHAHPTETSCSRSETWSGCWGVSAGMAVEKKKKCFWRKRTLMRLVNGEKIGQKTNFLDWKLKISHHCFKRTYNVMRLNGAERREKKMGGVTKHEQLFVFKLSGQWKGNVCLADYFCLWQPVCLPDLLCQCQTVFFKTQN